MSKAAASAFASFDQLILPSLFALNAIDRAIGGLDVGVPVQRHPDRKSGRRVASDDLNAGNSLAPGPKPNCLKAFLAESPIPDANCFESHHGRIYRRDRQKRKIKTKIMARAISIQF
jgi:hypothetical protein